MKPHPNADKLLGTPISEFRCVHKQYESRRIHGKLIAGSRETYVMHKDDVAKFVEAQVKLHYWPGVNPANGSKTEPLRELHESPFCPQGPYWWTTPSLEGNDDYGHGATIMQMDYHQKLLWRNPAYQALLDAEQREMD